MLLIILGHSYFAVSSNKKFIFIAVTINSSLNSDSVTLSARSTTRRAGGAYNLAVKPPSPTPACGQQTRVGPFLPLTDCRLQIAYNFANILLKVFYEVSCARCNSSFFVELHFAGYD